MQPKRIFLAALMLLASSAANAIECRTSKGNVGWWTWRIIDGQKCWYEGRQVIDKTRLHWPVSKSKPVALEGCCWPALEKE